jgi:hypothetical protein
MGKDISDFWQAAQDFRSAQGIETRHKARVALLRIALGNNNVSQRAVDLLRTEGLVIIREAAVLKTKAH